jgi:Cu/Ag efflux protein CusF
MKKQISTFLLVALAGFTSYAQCNKKINLSANSTEYLSGTGEVQKTDAQLTTIVYDSKEISILAGDNAMDGTVNSITCDWKTPFKEGKTIIKATISNPNGQNMNLILTIEGKDGKNMMMAVFEEMPDLKIRMPVDKFEEKM